MDDKCGLGKHLGSWSAGRSSFDNVSVARRHSLLSSPSIPWIGPDTSQCRWRFRGSQTAQKQLLSLNFIPHSSEKSRSVNLVVRGNASFGHRGHMPTCSQKPHTQGLQVSPLAMFFSATKRLKEMVLRLYHMISFEMLCEWSWVIDFFSQSRAWNATLYFPFSSRYTFCLFCQRAGCNNTPVFLATKITRLFWMCYATRQGFLFSYAYEIECS